MNITKELVDKLASDEITKKEYEKIIAVINDKVGDIWCYICEVSNRQLDWWTFDNDVSYGHGGGFSGGEFDPVEYKEWIEITGEYELLYKNKYYPYNNGFPTELLWNTDWKETVEENIKESFHKHSESKLSLKIKREETKIKNKKLIESIRQKLTKEELKLIKIK